MDLLETRCAICGDYKDFTVLYKMNLTESDLNLDTFSARKSPDGIHYQIVKCNKDGLVRSNPVLSESALKNFYKRSKFTYQHEIDNLSVTYLDALKRVLNKLSPDAALLEVGCGNGFLLKELYDAGHKNVYGVEPSIEAVSQACGYIRERIKTEALQEGTFTRNMFDFVFFFQTLEHITDPNSFLNICHNILKPGGYVLVFSHDIRSLQAIVLKEKSPIIDIGHTYLYSKDTIRKTLQKNGFVVKEVYSPVNVVSVRHIIRLTPMPGYIKSKLLGTKNKALGTLFDKRIRIKLGNLCAVAQKPL